MALKDKDIREPLFDFLEELYGKIVSVQHSPTHSAAPRICEGTEQIRKVRFIEEKNVGRSRADVLMVTERELIGVEIKSDADTYRRLASQVKDYDRFCDRNYAAVGSSHAFHIAEHIPEYWGIITIDEVNGAPDFYVYRRPQVNPNMKPEQKIRLLWRRELAHILALNHLPKYREKSKLFVERKILEKVAPEVLWPQFSEELFERDYNTIEDEIRQYRSHKTRQYSGI